MQIFTALPALFFLAGSSFLHRQYLQSKKSRVATAYPEANVSSCFWAVDGSASRYRSWCEQEDERDLVLEEICLEIGVLPYEQDMPLMPNRVGGGRCNLVPVGLIRNTALC